MTSTIEELVQFKNRSEEDQVQMQTLNNQIKSMIFDFENMQK